MRKASELIGFDPIGRVSAIVSEHRDDLLGTAFKPIPGHFSKLASYEVPHSVAEAIGEMLGLRNAHSIGISDGIHTFGNIQLYTRAHYAVPETHLIEYFANHCYSVLMGIERERKLTDSNTRLNQLIDSMVEGLALHEIILDEEVSRACLSCFRDDGFSFSD